MLIACAGSCVNVYVESNSRFNVLLLVLAVLALSVSMPGRAALLWHWEDSFTPSEQDKLRAWLEDTHAALERYGGPLPFDVHLYMHRRDKQTQPVPWANTQRNQEQALHFYVDPQFSRQAFMDDWTAAHEFSHLLLPYVGRSNAWFAEGFASYLQHSVMVELGVITAREALLRRGRKMDKAVAALRNSTVSLPDNMPELKAQRSYPTFYWGGAVYFERVDAALMQQGSSLQGALRSYVACCRLGRRGLDALVSVLNEVSGSHAFASELEAMRTVSGVPPRPHDFLVATDKKKGP